jgi:hypothetical protein
MDKLVCIVADNLPEQVARNMERERIVNSKPWPIFNVQGIPKRLGSFELEAMVDLHLKHKMSYRQIARRMNKLPEVIENELIFLGYKPID